MFFFGTVLTALFLIVRGMKRYKETEHGSVLKFFAIMNILSFCPFIFFFVIPYVFFDKYLIDPFILTSVVLLIPFSLVYQFVTNKIYNMNFLISRLRYYGFLAITPTLFV
ncbi:histidine kinase, partial [Bacillus altitudinis]